MGRYAPSYFGRTAALHVQLTPSERADFEAAAASAGAASLSAFARFILFLRREADSVTATRRDPDASRLVAKLKAIGNDLDQLTDLAHRTGAVALEEELRATTSLLNAAITHVITRFNLTDA
jgi:Zn-dependent oligopeptidase